jgi:hypothetical protein
MIRIYSLSRVRQAPNGRETTASAESPHPVIVADMIEGERDSGSGGQLLREGRIVSVSPALLPLLLFSFFHGGPGGWLRGGGLGVRAVDPTCADGAVAPRWLVPVICVTE